MCNQKIYIDINFEDDVYFVYPTNDDLNGSFLIETVSEDDANNVKRRIESGDLTPPLNDNYNGFSFLRLSNDTPVYKLNIIS